MSRPDGRSSSGVSECWDRSPPSPRSASTSSTSSKASARSRRSSMYSRRLSPVSASPWSERGQEGSSVDVAGSHLGGSRRSRTPLRRFRGGSTAHALRIPSGHAHRQSQRISTCSAAEASRCSVRPDLRSSPQAPRLAANASAQARWARAGTNRRGPFRVSCSGLSAGSQLGMSRLLDGEAALGRR